MSIQGVFFQKEKGKQIIWILFSKRVVGRKLTQCFTINTFFRRTKQNHHEECEVDIDIHTHKYVHVCALACQYVCACSRDFLL